MRTIYMLSLWLGALLATPLVWAGSSATPKFQLYLTPAKDWHVLVGQQAGAIMPYQRWQQLWAQRLVALQSSRGVRSLPPMLSRLEITGAVRPGGRALGLQIKLKIASLSSGWKRFPLSLRGVAFRRFRLEGVDGLLGWRCPGSTSCAMAQRQLWVTLKGPGHGTLWLWGGVPIKKTPQGQLVRFQVPRAAASTLRLRLPKRQEFESPLKALALRYERGQSWIFGGLGKAREVKLLFRPFEVGARQKVMLASKSTAHYLLQPAFQWLTTKISLLDRMGQRRSYVLQLPEGFRLLSLRSGQLAGLALRGQTLHVRMRAGRSPRTLWLRLVRQDAPKELSLSPIRVLGAYSQTGTIAVSLHRDLLARVHAASGLARVVPTKAHLSKNAKYAMLFEYWRPKSRLQLRLLRVKPRLSLQAVASLRVKSQQAILQLTVRLICQAGRVRTLRWLMPRGWQLSQLQDAQGRTLRYQREARQHGVSEHWFLRLSKPLEEGQSARLHLRISQVLTLPRRGAMTLAIPRFAFGLPGQKWLQGRGTLKIVYPRFYQGSLARLQGLREVSLAHQGRWTTQRFQLAAMPVGGTLTLTRKRTRIQVLTYGRYHVQDNQIVCVWDAYLKIQGAGTYDVVLELSPLGKQKSMQPLELRVLGNRIISRQRMNRPDGGVRWRLKLAREHFGRLVLQARLLLPLKGRGVGDVVLPMLSSPGAETERGFVAVTTAPSIQLHAQTKGLLAIDPLLLPSPLLGKASQRPVLSYRAPTRIRSLRLRFRKMKRLQLLQGVVERLVLKAQMKPNGHFSIRALFTFLSKGVNEFEVTLPKASELWGVALQGRGIKPMREGRIVRIPLPLGRRTGRYQIALTYVLQGLKLPARAGLLQLPAPTVSYPVQRTRWSAYIPHTYAVLGAQTPFAFDGGKRPRPLLAAAVSFFSRSPTALVLVLALLLLCFLRRWVFRLFAALWRWTKALFGYLFGRWYRWVIALGVGIFALPFFFYASRPMYTKEVQRAYAPMNAARYLGRAKGKEMAKKPMLRESGGPRTTTAKEPRPKLDKVVPSAEKVTAFKSKRRRRRRRYRRRRYRRKHKRRRFRRAHRYKQKWQKNEHDVRRSFPRRGAEPSSPMVAVPKLPPATTGKDASTKALRDARKEGRQIQRKALSGLLGGRSRLSAQQMRKLLDGKLGIKFPQKSAPGSSQGLGPSDEKKVRTALAHKSVEQRRKQQQQMLRWMMRRGESKMMRGIRSLEIPTQQVGRYLDTSGEDWLPTLRVELWHQRWLQLWMWLSFLVGLLVFALLSWWLPARRRWLLWSGLLLSLTAGLLVEGVWIASLNAFGLGILVAGLLVLLPRSRRLGGAVALALCVLGVPSAKAAAPVPVGASAVARRAAPLAKSGPRAVVAARTRATKAPGGSPCVLPSVLSMSASDRGRVGQVARLYVPYQWKHGADAVGPETKVFVPRAWWLLLQSSRCAKLPASAAFWVQAHYQLDLRKRSLLQGTATYDIVLYKRGWHQVPLGLRGVEVAAEELRQVALGRGRIRYQQRGYVAMLPGPGRYRLVLRFQQRRAAGQRRVSLALAPAVAASLTATLPRGAWQVEVPQARGGVSWTRTKQQTTVRAILGTARKVSLRWRPTHAVVMRQETPQVVAYTRLSIHEQLVRMRTQYAFSSQYDKSDRFVFALPKGMLLERLVGADIRRWYFRERAGRRELVLRLQKPVLRYQLELQAVTLRQHAQEKRSLVLPTPLHVSQQSGLIGVWVGARVEAALLGVEGLEKRTPAAFRRATRWFRAPVQEVYAYRRVPTLSAVLRPRKLQLDVALMIRAAFTPSHTASAQSGWTRVVATLRYTKVNQPTFVLSLWISSRFRVGWVETLTAQGIRQFWLGKARKDGLRRLFVELREPLRRGQLLFLQGSLPGGADAELPVLFPASARQVKGGLALYTPVDYEAQTAQLDGLQATSLAELSDVWEDAFSKGQLPSKEKPPLLSEEPLLGRALSDAKLVFRFQRRYKGRLRMEKASSSARCEGDIFVFVEENLATVRVRLHYEATGAGKRQWQVVVPGALAKRLVWQTSFANGSLSRKPLSDGRVRLTWRQLQPTTAQTLSFRFFSSIPKSGILRLGGIEPVGVSGWWLRILVGKRSLLRVHLSKNHSLEKLSLAALPGALRRKVKGLVGAYRVRKAPWQLRLRRESLRSEVVVRPAVEVAHIETFLSAQGRAWSQVTYTLRTPGLQALTLELPKGAKLWQVLVAGRDLRPSPGDAPGRYVLVLPPRRSSDLAYEIRALYAHKVALPAGFGSVTLVPPRLEQIDVVETFWSVALPRSYRLGWSSGNMEPRVRTQVLVNRLQRAFQFTQKLKQMAAVGSRQQQLRAQQSLLQQQRLLSGELQRARRAQAQAWSRFSRSHREQKKLRKIDALLRDLRQELKQLQRTRGVASSTISSAPSSYWKKQFQLSLKIATPKRQMVRAAQGLFQLPRHGGEQTFGTVGGAPQLTLTLYHKTILAKALSWLCWSILVLLCLLGWRRGWGTRA